MYLKNDLFVTAGEVAQDLGVYKPFAYKLMRQMNEELEEKGFAADLKTIYLAPSEEQGRAQLERVTEKWEEKYPNAMKSWAQNWDVISPIFKFSNDVRKVIYTTNAIESLNSTYKKLNRQRTVFPSDKALLKSLYLSTLQATKKWTQPLRNWGKVYGEFTVMYEGRIPC